MCIFMPDHIQAVHIWHCTYKDSVEENPRRDSSMSDIFAVRHRILIGLIGTEVYVAGIDSAQAVQSPIFF